MKHIFREEEVDVVFEKIKNLKTPLIDVRDKQETSLGIAKCAINLPLSELKENIVNLKLDKKQEIYVICASGVRSIKAIKILQEMGYINVFSVRGGFLQWKENKLPYICDYNENLKRYDRQIILKDIGKKGQIKLMNTKVLIVGCGGLGSPALLYLAAAGVGTLGIVDNDVINISNLHRQILFDEKKVGQIKVEVAKQKLLDLNSNLKLNIYNLRIDKDNIDSIIKNYDIIIDGTDNFNTRYLVNDACIKFEKPNVHGSVFQYEGQVSVFFPNSKNAPCYRCLYPTPPPKEFSISCSEGGVLGPLPGIIGTLCAIEAIKLILKIGDSLIGKLLVYDLLNAEFNKLDIEKNENCIYCNRKLNTEFPEYSDYNNNCTI